MSRRSASRWLELYQSAVGIKARVFSRAVASSFASFGEGSIIEPPANLQGVSRVTIGARVYIGPGSWLFTQGEAARLEIGDGTRMSGWCVVSAVREVTLGRSVLLGRNVYIADHNHGSSDPLVPIADQELEKVAPVSIGDGAWLGQNSVVLSGVSIGAGAVIGANSVVLDDVPARCVAAGAPARVVKELPR